MNPSRGVSASPSGLHSEPLAQAGICMQTLPLSHPISLPNQFVGRHLGAWAQSLEYQPVSYDHPPPCLTLILQQFFTPELK